MTTQPIATECYRTPVPLRRNQLHRFAGRVHEVLDEIGEVQSWALSPHERGEALAELVALQDRVQARVLALVADAERADDAASGGATHTAGWVKSCTGLTSAESSRLVKQANALESHEAVATALAAGVIHSEQAKAIVAAVDALPREVAAQVEAAEQHLLEAADDHDAKALAALGKHLLEVVAPDEADALIARQLEREEADAARTAYLTTWCDGHGSRYGRFKIPELSASMLDTMLEAIANPDRPDPIHREGVSAPQVRGRAFSELLERYPVSRVPTSGGVNAQVVVVMTLETLSGGLRAAGILGTDQQISPGQARRLADAAGVIPAVTGGPSQLLDLGRRRTFSATQRLAMALRQGGVCNIVGCDRPATWCDANHRIPYAKGGRTTLDNGELIPPGHHTLVHQAHDYPRRT